MTVAEVASRLCLVDSAEAERISIELGAELSHSTGTCPKCGCPPTNHIHRCTDGYLRVVFDCEGHRAYPVIGLSNPCIVSGDALKG